LKIIFKKLISRKKNQSLTKKKKKKIKTNFKEVIKLFSSFCFVGRKPWNKLTKQNENHFPAAGIMTFHP
jgi:hypothetical protein